MLNFFDRVTRRVTFMEPLPGGSLVCFPGATFGCGVCNWPRPRCAGRMAARKIACPPDRVIAPVARTNGRPALRPLPELSHRHSFFFDSAVIFGSLASSCGGVTEGRDAELIELWWVHWDHERSL